MKIDSYIKEQFGIKDVDIRTYSPLTLAYEIVRQRLKSGK